MTHLCYGSFKILMYSEVPESSVTNKLPSTLHQQIEIVFRHH